MVMDMLLTYADALKTYGSAYQIGRAVRDGAIYKVARGVYSTAQHPNPSAVVCARYPHAILTMESAFYLHDLTDVVPELVYVATPRNSTRIKNASVRQYFMEPHLMMSGAATFEIDGLPVRAFTKERMLVELLRSAGSLPLDYYKEIIGSYRKLVDELDMRAVEDAMALYKRSDGLFEMMQREVL